MAGCGYKCPEVVIRLFVWFSYSDSSQNSGYWDRNESLISYGDIISLINCDTKEQINSCCISENDRHYFDYEASHIAFVKIGENKTDVIIGDEVLSFYPSKGYMFVEGTFINNGTHFVIFSRDKGGERKSILEFLFWIKHSCEVVLNPPRAVKP